MQEIFVVFTEKNGENLAFFKKLIFGIKKDLQRKTWRSFAIKKKTTTKNINRDVKRQVPFEIVWSLLRFFLIEIELFSRAFLKN